MNAREWHCAAYGAELDELMGRPMCFVDNGQGLACTSSRQCSVRMHRERRRLWARILELAAGGDETSKYLLTEFAGPEELLARLDAISGDGVPGPEEAPPS